MTASGTDPHDLARFIAAQQPTIDRVRAELRAGRDCAEVNHSRDPAAVMWVT
jgi:uncharacterized protein (DUF1810 family)